MRLEIYQEVEEIIERCKSINDETVGKERSELRGSLILCVEFTFLPSLN